MKRITLLLIVLLTITSTYGQSPCSHNFTLTRANTNNQTRFKLDASSGSVSGNRSITYKVDWGDNTPLANYWTYQNNSISVYHTYAVDGIYTVKLIVEVVDSTNNIRTIVCTDSSSKTDTAVRCNVTFNTNYDTALNGKMNFNIVNPSSWTTYTWDFGDGNTGSGTSVSNTYPQHKKYTVKVTASNNMCTDTATRDITPINGCNNLAGLMNGSIQYNSSSQKYLGHFKSNSLGYLQQRILPYFSWDFGDGTPRTTPSPWNSTIYHQYNSMGLYTVTLITELYDSVNNVTICKDTFQKQFQAGYNNFSGSIKVDSTKAQLGDTLFKVWLITFNSATNILQAVDSQTISTHGYSFAYYSFPNTQPGNYRVKAASVNGPSSGTGHVPTYSTNSLMWNNATTHLHTGGVTNNATIIMKKGTVTNGPGFIGGNVNQGANKGTSSGIEGMTILLLDAGNNAIAFTNTDNNGAYEFSNIPVGTYTIHPENLGDATIAASITIAPGNTQFSGINFERSNSSKTIFPKPAGITNINAATSYTVYPNPAHDVVNITWAEFSKDVANISITDISGKKVYSNAIQMNSNTAINVQNLQSGFYFLNVATENGSTTQKLLIK